jgi:bacterioferritin-associated ferredoxin
VAAGILGCGPVLLGTAEECARLLEAAQERVAAGAAPAAVAEELTRAIHASGGKVPGFGHPVHRPLDPRAERIVELADARGVSGPHVLLARCVRDGVEQAWGKPLPMNVSMPIAAVMLDLGGPPEADDPDAHVCNCNGVSTRQIRACVTAGKRTLSEVAAETRAGTGCGSCTDRVVEIIRSATSDDASTDAAWRPARAA